MILWANQFRELSQQKTVKFIFPDGFPSASLASLYQVIGRFDKSQSFFWGVGGDMMTQGYTDLDIRGKEWEHQVTLAQVFMEPQAGMDTGETHTVTGILKRPVDN